MRRLIRALCAAGLFLAFPAGAAALTGAGTGVSDGQWERLASRAAEVISAAAASSPALAVLRSDLVGWSEKFAAGQEPLRGEIERLNARLAALGEAAEGESSDGELAKRRSELRARLLELNEPFLSAEESMLEAEGLIAQIDDILKTRSRELRYSRGPTPLNPAHWDAAAGRTAEYFLSVADEISASWTSEAQRASFFERFPLTLALAALGLLLLTRARGLALRAADRIMPVAVETPLAAGGFRGLLADVVMPVAGFYLLVAAARSTNLFYVYGDSLLAPLPVAAAIVFIANWLAKALFAADGTAHFAAGPGPEWSRSVRRTVSWIGWILAADVAIAGSLPGIKVESPGAVTLNFPIIVAAAILMFQLCRRISEHLAALSSSDDDRPISDTVFSAFIWIARAAAAAGVVFALAGYDALGHLLVFPSLLTLALLGACFVLEALCAGLVTEITGRTGIADGTAKVGLIRILIGALLFFAALPVLALIWGAGWSDIVDAWNRAGQGVSFGGQQITAKDVLGFVLTFAVGCLATALIQSVLRRSILPNTQLAPGAQRALITGTGYVGVILAVILAISVAGIDFTNIAIVAGALSVGIGFGLQTVVSNFVSGIILLVERPVTVGDWIEVGGVSGTVRKISVRATQVETFDRCRVVVPNSDLIASQVSNWTLENRVGRVILPIGVSYGTNPRWVQQILLEIAGGHPAVLKDPKPSAVFMRFGADALEFELRVILTDINYILSARSDLNIAIAERFEKEGISIPFPQRDIWVRNAPELLGKEKTSESDCQGEETHDR